VGQPFSMTFRFHIVGKGALQPMSVNLSVCLSIASAVASSTLNLLSAEGAAVSDDVTILVARDDSLSSVSTLILTWILTV